MNPSSRRPHPRSVRRRRSPACANEKSLPCMPRDNRKGTSGPESLVGQWAGARIDAGTMHQGPASGKQHHTKRYHWRRPCFAHDAYFEMRRIANDHDRGSSLMATRKKSTRKYGKAASKRVESAMKKRKKGTLRSGRGGKGGKVKSRKQAIAIGLSEARAKGAKVPKKRKSSGGRKKAASKRK
ncbi:MAG TPA: DUF6496 domain-containing protein [Gemmatimonadaceae bacterium]|nr:DUF6496 domain-containing protein [Gemmatimonadaceae bacterium]